MAINYHVGDENQTTGPLQEGAVFLNTEPSLQSLSLGCDARYALSSYKGKSTWAQSPGVALGVRAVGIFEVLTESRLQMAWGVPQVTKLHRTVWPYSELSRPVTGPRLATARWRLDFLNPACIVPFQ